MFEKQFGCLWVVVWLVGSHVALAAGPLPLDQREAGPGEWGFRPHEGRSCATTPPGFVWRPQERAAHYTLQCARDAAFRQIAYQANDLEFNCHCPAKMFAQGVWYWRFRYADASGQQSPWSKTRRFSVPSSAVALPMPVRTELLARIPKNHPRLFIRPEDLSTLRRRAKGDLKPQYDSLVKLCDRLLKKPPSTKEPPKYPEGTVRKSEGWRKIWWGNRTRTRAVLENASTLAFTRLLGGSDAYGQLAKRLLLAAAEWDPKGATGYRYNDEAGMPYAYYFARTYTFVNDLLTDAEKAKCREVMRIRGDEMYRHLCPRHLWRPYASHSNRAWHFLGEVGIAFLDEIPEAANWVWFAMNVFYNVYPVWCDDDGGWHEGVSYWRSYIYRFTWWADVMRAAMSIDAYTKPYFSKVGYYPMYLLPPGTVGGGFGDLCANKRSGQNRQLMTVLAAQSGIGHWQWYVDAVGGPDSFGGYVGFIRGALPGVQPKPPTDLPPSRCFHGTGQAMLNTDLMNGKNNVQVIFKSSPFGTQSHGYESNNSFLLYAFGERLLIRTGRRDIYGSKHHTLWMWQTKSTNCITIDGNGQKRHTAAAQGRIVGFHTSDAFDYVAGEAGDAYEQPVGRFTRHILVVKPELVVIFDRLEVPKPSTFTWWLHGLKEMDVRSQRDITAKNNKARCAVSFLAPQGLKLSQTDKYDPPPRPRIKLTEWHLTAETPQPAKRCEFVTLLRPHRASEAPSNDASIERTPYGYKLDAKLKDSHVLIGLRSTDDAELKLQGLSAQGDVLAIRLDRAGKPIASFAAK